MLKIKNHVVGTKITTIILEIDMEAYKYQSTHTTSTSAFAEGIGRDLHGKLEKLFKEK